MAAYSVPRRLAYATHEHSTDGSQPPPPEPPVPPVVVVVWAGGGGGGGSVGLPHASPGSQTVVESQVGQHWVYDVRVPLVPSM